MQLYGSLFPRITASAAGASPSAILGLPGCVSLKRLVDAGRIFL